VALLTFPYYRDGSCFDDGTGTDPGPKLHLRSNDEPSTWGYDPVTGVAASPAPPGATTVYQRRCWNHHADGNPYNLAGTLTFDPTKPSESPDPVPDPTFSPQGDVRYYQGDVGTHGLHIELIPESDNAQLTAPVDEIDSQQTQVVLPGNQGNVGEQYGHAFDRPLVSVVTPFGRGSPLDGATDSAPSGRSTAAAPGGAARAPRASRADLRGWRPAKVAARRGGGTRLGTVHLALAAVAAGGLGLTGLWALSLLGVGATEGRLTGTARGAPSHREGLTRQRAR